MLDIIKKFIVISFFLLQGCSVGNEAKSLYGIARHFRQFQIIVDINQISSDELTKLSRFSVDGLWVITQSSYSKGIDWKSALRSLAASKWVISEDDPNQNFTNQVDLISSAISRIVNGAVFYNNDVLATPLSDIQVQNFANHVVPGYGPLGKRVIILTRSYGIGDPRREQLNHAIKNQYVAGAAFEFNPGIIHPERKYEEGCKYIISLKKNCYLLMPPPMHGTNNYLDNVQKTVLYYANSGILDSKNVYIVLAVYGRDQTTVGFAESDKNKYNNIEAVVKWLIKYRGF